MSLAGLFARAFGYRLIRKRREDQLLRLVVNHEFQAADMTPIAHMWTRRRSSSLCWIGMLQAGQRHGIGPRLPKMVTFVATD